MNRFLIFTLICFLYACGGNDETTSFKELANVEKEKIIKTKAVSYVNQNKSKTAFKNYFFLLNQQNKLRPCPEKEFKNLKVYFKDKITAELSLYPNQTYEYLKPDSEFGEIDMYGIQFTIIDTSGAVENFTTYTSYTKWGDGKLGEREHLGSDFQEYQGEKEVPNIKEKYGDKDLMAEVDRFFETEMKQKQIENKEKCK